MSRAPLAVRRALLERLSRPLLARFLATHAADFCAAHDISTGALAESDPRDRRLVHRLCALLRATDLAPPAFPDAAAEWLAILDALATTRGGEQLIALDVGRALPRAKLGDEDLALTAILELPDLARSAASLAPEAGDDIQSFTEYDPSESAPSPAPALHFDDASRLTLAALLGDEFEARDRTRYCEILVRREAQRIALEIDYGRRPKTRDKLDPEALTVAPTTDINPERAFAEIDRSSRRLAIHAPHPAIKELIRKALGQVVAGNREHFTAARVYDLSPFNDLDVALSPQDVHRRLLTVALHRLTVRTAGDSEMDLSRARKDLRSDVALEPVVRDASRIGVPVAVRLYLGILDRRLPLKVELSAKQGRNRLQFNREDPADAAVVRAYFLARRVLRELDKTASESETAS